LLQATVMARGRSIGRVYCQPARCGRVPRKTTLGRLSVLCSDAPSAKSQNDNAELIAPIRKGIGGSRGMVAVELAAYEAMCLECFKTIREDIGRHARQTFLKVLKPHGAGEKVTDDQQRPARAHDIERPRHRTRRIKAVLYHFGLNHLVCCKRSRQNVPCQDIVSIVPIGTPFLISDNKSSNGRSGPGSSRLRIKTETSAEKPAVVGRHVIGLKLIPSWGRSRGTQREIPAAVFYSLAGLKFLYSCNAR
jgi:hypothetical protein